MTENFVHPIEKIANRDSIQAMTPEQVHDITDLVSDPYGVRSRLEEQLDAVYQLNETMSGQLNELKRQADAQEQQIDELKRQAAAQENIHMQLQEESKSREKDDKKYFWLGAIVSLGISAVIEVLSRLL